MPRFRDNFYALIVTIMLLWAATASVVPYLYHQGLTAEEVTVLDICIAFVTLLGLTLAIPGRRRSLRRYRWRHVPALAICSLVGITAYNYLLYKSYSSNAQNVVPYVIINYMWPLTTILFGLVILKERATAYTWIGGGVGFLGFLLIQAGKVFESAAVGEAWRAGGAGEFVRTFLATSGGDATAVGCLLALAGAILWGLFGPLARRWSDKYGFDPVSSMMLFAGIGTACVLAMFGSRVRWGFVFGRWDVVLCLVWLGAGAHGLVNIMWLRAIKVGGAGRTGIVAYLTPVLALAYLALFHRQFPSWYSGLGLALILGAIVLVETHRRGRRSAGRKAGPRPDRAGPGG